jgi:hypothetical protein
VTKRDPAPQTLPTPEGQPMTARRLVTLTLAGAAFLLIPAGVAHADEDDSEGYPSTQSPTQGADAGAATVNNSRDSFNDAADGDNRPDGANGTETQFVQPDPRYVEGPVGGLLKNGPLK